MDAEPMALDMAVGWGIWMYQQTFGRYMSRSAAESTPIKTDGATLLIGGHAPVAIHIVRFQPMPPP